MSYRVTLAETKTVLLMLFFYLKSSKTFEKTSASVPTLRNIELSNSSAESLLKSSLVALNTFQLRYVKMAEESLCQALDLLFKCLTENYVTVSSLSFGSSLFQ